MIHSQIQTFTQDEDSQWVDTIQNDYANSNNKLQSIDNGEQSRTIGTVIVVVHVEHREDYPFHFKVISNILWKLNWLDS